MQSDLAAGSGYSFAGVVDSDICYDDIGIPYIPGKRIKGCLREIASSLLYSFVCEEDISRIFGDPGDSKRMGFQVGNAYPEQYDLLRKTISARRDENDYSSFYGKQAILRNFSHVIAQTELDDNGIALENSLRFTRVINRYKTGDSKREPMVFLSEITFPKDDKDIIESIIKGLRHIGLKRNRGLGNVVCSVEDVKTDDVNKKRNWEYGNKPDHINNDTEYDFLIRISNVDPLMLSSMMEDESESYISGTAFLGALAGLYLKSGGDSESDTFRSLFLSKETKYSNLYPWAEGSIFYPAPEYINKRKKTKDLVNFLDLDWPSHVPNERRDSGNTPKKIREMFVSTDKGWTNLSIMEIAKELTYHHSHYKEDNEGKEGILYGMEVVAPGQFFAGSIRLKGKYIPIIEKLLSEGVLYFGKSRTAQYGKCRVIKCDIEEVTNEPQSYGKDDSLIITFLSDAIFFDEDEREYSVYFDKIQNILCRELFGEEKRSTEEKNLDRAMLQAKTLTGFSQVWNLKKMPVPAIRAGSAYIYKPIMDGVVSKYQFIGERTHEGYGRIRIDVVKNEMTLNPIEFKEVSAFNVFKDEVAQDDQVKEILKEVLVTEWISEKKYEALEEKPIKVSKSSLGRITLMLKESMDENKNDMRNCYTDFAARILSIKQIETRDEGKYVLETFGKENLDNGQWVLKWNKLPMSLGTDSEDLCVKEMATIGCEEDEIRNLLENRWAEYLMAALVDQKYQYEKGEFSQ